jgi:uncharacterized protein
MDIPKTGSFKIIVKANQHKNIIEKYDSDKNAFRIDICQPAEDNKANIEIIKFFKKEYGISVKIIKGLTSREKVLKIT